MINYIKRMKFKELSQEIDWISKEIEKQELPKSFLDFIMYALAELSANIEEHSKAKNINLKIILDKDCLMEFSDDGIGLKESYISKNIYPKDDSAAIEFALGGLSTKNQQERGFGLYSTRKIIEKMKGEMIVETGSTQAIIKENQIFFKDIPQTKGTSIKLNVKIKKLDFYSAVE